MKTSAWHSCKWFAQGFASVALVMSVTACDSLPDWMQSNGDDKPKLAGDRVAILKQDEGLKADESLAATPILLPEAKARENWEAHSGSVEGFVEHVAFVDTPSKQDSVSVGGGAAFEHGEAVKPLVVGGVVYAMDAEGVISAHQADNISNILWSNQGVANEDGDRMLAGGLAYGDGKLLALSGNGLLAAFEPASGRELWRQAVNIPVRAAPTVAGGKVFVVTIDSQMFVFDATTGNSLWVDRGISEGASFVAKASASYANGLIAIPYASSELRILTADDGQQIWSDVLAMTKRNAATSSFSGMGGDPVILGNAIYAVSASGLLSAYRLDNGLRVWEQPISSVNTPCLVGDVLYVLSSDDQLVALNRMDGRIYWVTPLPQFANEKNQDGAYTWSGPLLAGGKLYVVGSHGELKRFDAVTGALIDTLDVPDGIVTAPVVANGKMYFASQNAKLIALY